jgi:hypothetical protein
VIRIWSHENVDRAARLIARLTGRGGRAGRRSSRASR